MKRFVAILMAAAMLLTVLAGCSGSTKPADTTPAADSSTAAAETESAAPSASAITVVLSDVGNNMDPSVANAINTFTIMSHVYDNLLNCNLDFSLQPGVIASWEQPDELTYKLTVGDGFMFQNGEPLEVEDVVYSLTRLENVSQTADLYAQIDSVSAEGNVVTIVLKEANSGFIRDLVEVPVLNKSYCEEVGDAYANAPIGTGPYVMSEFVPGEKAVLTAWADYPGQKASIETITFKAIAEPSAAYIAVEAGDADFTEIDATDYARAEANDNLVFYTGDTTYTAFVAMNTQEPPFDNVNVRKAMAYAYNKEGYLNVKGENYHTIDSMFPMMSEYYYASDDAITYDLEKAKELLAAEGYDESNPLTFEIIGYSNNDVVMQAYQADLKSIGVNVELVTQEFGVFLENMVGMNFQMLTGGWGDTTGNPLTSAECYYSGSFGSQNISFYDNPVCDELYITAKTSNDTAEIIQLPQEAVIGPVGRQWLHDIEPAVVGNEAIVVQIIHQICDLREALTFHNDKSADHGFFGEAPPPGCRPGQREVQAAEKLVVECSGALGCEQRHILNDFLSVDSGQPLSGWFSLKSILPKRGSAFYII